MSYYCGNCGAVVSEDEVLTHYERDEMHPHGEWMVCPNCKEEELEDMAKCEICGDEITPEHRYCVTCDYYASAALGEAITYLRKRAPTKKTYDDVKEMFFDWCSWKGIL